MWRRREVMDPLDLPSWWSLEVLARVWELIANRLERNGIRPTGRRFRKFTLQANWSAGVILRWNCTNVAN